MAIRELYGPVSDSYLRKILMDSGAPLHPLVEGVRQESFQSLERTLLTLREMYRECPAQTRRLVIAAKDHAKLAARRAEAKTTKEEMALWMLTWLENPALFGDWLAMRKRVIESRSIPPG